MMSGTESLAARLREVLDAMDAARGSLSDFHDALASPAIESAVPSSELLEEVDRAREVLVALRPALFDLRRGAGG
jgi:hypothetical protein